MSKRVVSCLVCVGLLATGTMLSTNYSTLTADDCLAGPNRPPAQGGHWYYHLDRANNRKCWYLVEPAAQPPTAEASQSQPAPDPIPPAPPTPQPAFGGFFSSLGFPWTGTQPNTTGDVRIVQPAPANDLKTDAAPPARQPRMARRPDSEAALAPKPNRPAHVRPPAEHAEERPAASLNQQERDALFREFLRWRESQSP
jgi:hypothetical protein